MHVLTRNGDHYENIEKIIIEAIFSYIFQPADFIAEGEITYTEKQQYRERKVSCNYNGDFG